MLSAICSFRERNEPFTSSSGFSISSPECCSWHTPAENFEPLPKIWHLANYLSKLRPILISQAIWSFSNLRFSATGTLWPPAPLYLLISSFCIFVWQLRKMWLSLGLLESGIRFPTFHLFSLNTFEFQPYLHPWNPPQRGDRAPPASCSPWDIPTQIWEVNFSHPALKSHNYKELANLKTLKNRNTPPTFTYILLNRKNHSCPSTWIIHHPHEVMDALKMCLWVLKWWL